MAYGRTDKQRQPGTVTASVEVSPLRAAPSGPSAAAGPGYLGASSPPCPALRALRPPGPHPAAPRPARDPRGLLLLCCSLAGQLVCNLGACLGQSCRRPDPEETHDRRPPVLPCAAAQSQCQCQSQCLSSLLIARPYARRARLPVAWTQVLGLGRAPADLRTGRRTSPPPSVHAERRPAAPSRQQHACTRVPRVPA